MNIGNALKIAGISIVAQLAVASAVHVINPNFSYFQYVPAPVAEVQQQAQKKENLLREMAYPLVLQDIKETNLVYGMLQGRMPPAEERDSLKSKATLPHYDNLEEFLRYNEDEDPDSIKLMSGDGSKIYSLSYSSLYVPGAFYWSSNIGRICAAPSEEKEAAYRTLAANFEKGKSIDKGIIDTILAAPTSDCDYFIKKWDPNSEKEKEKHMRMALKEGQKAQKRILSGLDGHVLRYEFLQGEFPYSAFSNNAGGDSSLLFYTDPQVFRKLNESGIPDSIGFKDNKGVLYQLAFSPSFFDGNLIWFSSQKNNFCVAPNPQRVKNYRALANNFELGNGAEMDIVYSIINGEAIFCSIRG